VSVRNLGDWSPLDLDKDPIYTDLDRIEEARKRYYKIAVTIDDAITRLGKIVDVGSDGLAGQYVEGLKSEATSIRDNLTKAKVRYDDVASEIKKYQPNLQLALDDTEKALVAARAAKAARSTADAMADPRPAADGTIPPEEHKKGALKERAIEDANSDLTNAKNKLTNAMDALNTAGMSFGDAVNSNRYDDGLSDSGWDKFLDFLQNIGSKILAVLGVVLAILMIFIPGVNVILLAGFVVAGLTLAVDITLYVNDRGSLADVILSAIGLVLIGGTAVASLLAKWLSRTARYVASQALPAPWIELDLLGGGATSHIPPGNAATLWKNLSDWFNNPVTNWLIGSLWPRLVPEVDFLGSMFEQWKVVQGIWRTIFAGNLLSGVKETLALIGGLSGIRDLAAVMAAVGRSISVWWYVWGAVNSAFLTLQGIIYTILRQFEVIPAANPGKA
jgi:hypothetical protein